MARWHQPTCKRPEVILLDELPCCLSCDAVGPDADFQTEEELRVPHLAPDSQEKAFKLEWPASVRYTHSPEASTTTQLHPNYVAGSSAQEEQDVIITGPSDYSIPSAACESQIWPSILFLWPDDYEQLSPGHPKMDSRRCIRLLEVDPADRGDVIHANFIVREIWVGMSGYEAISYTWADKAGDLKKCRSIFIGPYWDVFFITRNCESAIRNVRKLHQKRTIWVDALCINQDDARERSHQVDLMNRIYENATEVLIFLGESSPDSDTALDIISRKFYKELALSSPEKKVSGRVNKSSSRIRSNVRHQDNHLNAEDLDALRSLFGRPYFHRLWVVQEVVLAKSISIFCGARSTPWPLAGMGEGEITIKAPIWTNYRQIRDKLSDDELLDLLVNTNACLCSDPRDKIFAILGLIKSWYGEPISPDYSRTIEEVFIGIAAYLVQRGHYASHIFTYACRNVKEPVDRLPSWVPDWRNLEAPSKAVGELSATIKEVMENPIYRRLDLSFGSNAFSNFEIMSDTGALRMKALRICEVRNRFTRDTGGKQWKTTELSSDSPPRMVLLSPPTIWIHDNDILYWLYGVNEYAILRLTSKNGYFSFVTTCRLLVDRSLSTEAAEAWRCFHPRIEQFSIHEERTVIEHERIVRGICLYSESLPSSQDTTFYIARERLLDAAWSLRVGMPSSESTVWKSWVEKEKTLAPIFGDVYCLTQLSAIFDNLVGFEFGAAGGLCYYWRDRRVGSLEALTHLLWSYIPQTRAPLKCPREFEGRKLFENPEALFKSLQEWATITEQLMSIVQTSSQMMENWWHAFPKARFPGVTERDDWFAFWEIYIGWRILGTAVHPETVLPYKKIARSILKVLLALATSPAAASPGSSLGLVGSDFYLTRFYHDIRGNLWDWQSWFDIMKERQRLWSPLEADITIQRWRQAASGDWDSEDIGQLSHLDQQMVARLKLKPLGLEVDAQPEYISLV